MRRALLSSIVCFLVACQPSSPQLTLDDFAADYVRLARSLGELAPAEMDFYFGPPSIAADAKLVAEGRASLVAAVASARASFVAFLEEEPSPRGTTLLKRIDELQRLIDTGSRHSFTEQIAQLYGLELSEVDQAALDLARVELDALLPGSGALMPRLREWQQQMMIPNDKRTAVFERALAECRAATAQHWPVSSNDKLMLEWHGKHGAAAWHSYQGNGEGTLAVAPQGLVDVSAVLDLACHEGYPGHQMQFLLLEENGMVPEATVSLTRSQRAVLQEGAAMLAVDFAFSPEQRLVLERDVLFPLAELDPSRAERNLKINQHLRTLQEEIPSILAAFLEGKLNFGAARMQLETKALASGAPELLQYAQQQGSYLAGYTLQAKALRDAAPAPLHGDAAWQWLQQQLRAE